MSSAHYNDLPPGLPTFAAAGMTLLKRVTLIARDGVIEAVHYPIFPSDSDAAWVVAQLQGRAPLD